MKIEVLPDKMFENIHGGLTAIEGGLVAGLITEIGGREFGALIKSQATDQDE